MIIPPPPYVPVAIRPMLFGDLYAGIWVTMANEWARQAWASGEIGITDRMVKP